MSQDSGQLFVLKVGSIFVSLCRTFANLRIENNVIFVINCLRAFAGTSFILKLGTYFSEIFVRLLIDKIYIEFVSVSIFRVFREASFRPKS